MAVVLACSGCSMGQAQRSACEVRLLPSGFPCRQHKHKGICGISQRAHSYCPGALLECASPKLYPSSRRTSPPNNSDGAGGDGRATHRLEKPVTKQQRSLKLSKENNSSARAKLSFPMPATQAQRNLRDQPAVYIANPPSPIPTPPRGHRGKTRTADGVGQPTTSRPDAKLRHPTHI